MTTAYVLTEGSYSDYHIVGVFSTEELAELCQKQNPGSDIEEWIIDPFENQLRAGLSCHIVWMHRDGTTGVVSSLSPNHAEEENYSFRVFSRHPGEMVMRLICFARDEQHAVKIANEKRAQLIAQNLWGINPK